VDDGKKGSREKRSYPVLESLFPPRPQAAPGDRLRTPGAAPLAFPAAPNRAPTQASAGGGAAKPADLIDFMV